MTMRRRGRSSFGRRTGPKRKTSWQQSIFFVELPATGAIVAADLTPEPIRTGGDSHRGGTATLMRGIIHFDLGSVSPNTTLEVASVGIYVASHEAILQTAFSDPNSDPQQDWYYWTSRALGMLSASDDTQGISWDVDLKTKRRLRAGYDLLMVLAAASSNTIALKALVTLRLLWAIP